MILVLRYSRSLEQGGWGWAVLEEQRGQHSELWLALRELASGKGVYRDDLIEALQDGGKLAPLRRCWTVNTSNGIDTARVTITANIRAHIGKIKPRQARQNISAQERKRQYEQGVLLSFNASGPALHDTDLTRRREMLQAGQGGCKSLSERTSRRDLDHAISEIESQILASGYVPLAEVPAPDPAAPAPGARLYISRPKLETGIKRSLNGGARVVLLYGDSGNGKTMLAREVIDGHDALFLSASQPALYYQELANALRTRGLDSDWTDGNIHLMFADLLKSNDRPKILVLDDLVSDALLPSLLGRLSLSELRTQVILTARRQIITDEQGVSIHVGAMREIEAAQLLMSKNLLTDEGLALLDMFGRQPLPLVHASNGLAVLGSGFEARLQQIAHYRPPAKALYFLYVALNKEILAQDARAARTMIYLAFLDRSVARSILEYAAQGAEESEGADPDAFTRSLALLESLGLIEQEGGIISVHPVVQRYLMTIYRGTAKMMASLLYPAIFQARSDCLRQAAGTSGAECVDKLNMHDRIVDQYFQIRLARHIAEGSDESRAELSGIGEELMTLLWMRASPIRWWGSPVDCVDAVLAEASQLPVTVRDLARRALKKDPEFSWMVESWSREHEGLSPFESELPEARVYPDYYFTFGVERDDASLIWMRTSAFPWERGGIRIDSPDRDHPSPQ